MHAPQLLEETDAPTATSKGPASTSPVPVTALAVGTGSEAGLYNILVRPRGDSWFHSRAHPVSTLESDGHVPALPSWRLSTDSDGYIHGLMVP